MPGARFIWVGSGPLYEESIHLVEELGMQDVFHFAGERKDVPSILQSLDCFVLPSLWEGLSVVLLEAMAAGAPVVATNIPGNDEVIIDGQTGWLVPADDPQSMARKILHLLKNPEQARMFGSAAREYTQKEFTFAQMIRSVEKIYLETVARRSA
jgi:glycosyltransferase involved in cell wall biosynthesis